MRKIKLFIPFAFLFFLTGCATKIHKQVVRPAELNLNGAKTIAVLPFKTSQTEQSSSRSNLDILDFFFVASGSSNSSSETSDRKKVCEAVTEKLTTAFVDDDYFTVVSSSSVQDALKKGKTPKCDVYLTGYLYNYDDEIEKIENKKDGKKEIKYQRHAEATIIYEIVDAKTNTVLTHRYKTIGGYSSYEKSKNKLSSGVELIRNNMSSLITDLRRLTKPYTVTVTFTLLEDKTKDARIQDAHELAKNKDLEMAKDAFLKEYDRTGNFECAYNAAVLMEVMQEYDEAEKLAENLYKKTADKRALKLLNNIQSEKQYAEKLKNQVDARDNSSKK